MNFTPKTYFTDFFLAWRNMKAEKEGEEQGHCQTPGTQYEPAVQSHNKSYNFLFTFFIFFISKVDPSTCTFEKFCHMAQTVVSSRRKNQPHVIQMSYNFLICCCWKMFWHCRARFIGHKPSFLQAGDTWAKVEKEQSSAVYRHVHI